MLGAPRVFRAPEAPAAREARRPHFVRRRASKPARALRSLRRPPRQWGWVADVWFSASSRSPARPRRRPPAPRPGPPIPPAPSTSAALVADRVRRVASKPGISTITCRSVKCARGNVCEYVLSRPCRRLSNFARNSHLAVSNFEFVSLELQRFREVSKNDRDKLRAKFVWRWPCEPMLAQPTGRSLHRGRVLWFLRCLPH